MAQLEPRRQRNVLRVWLRSRGARAPSTRKLAALQHDMLVASHDRSPCVAWDDFEVRRHRGLLYADAKLPAIPEATLELAWRWLEPIRLPAGLGALRTESGVGIGLATSKLPHELRICFRTGGEQLRIAGHAHRHQLKKLLQDAQVLPWWRSRIPLLYVGNQLAAVGDLWIAQEFAAGADDHGVQIVWEERPCIEAHNARP
jgi:tRNA(Ile)-lysidine synthase